jgi:DNA-binding beta-propeller fold protein YncE
MKIMVGLFFLLLSLSPSLRAASSPMVAEAPIPLAGKAGGFDFMAWDAGGNRIIAAHKRAGTLEVIDLSKDTLEKAVAVGDAQGVAIDNLNHKYFAGNDDAHSVVVVDSKTLAKGMEIKVDGAVDAITFDHLNFKIYAAQDDGDHLWVINSKTGKVETTIAIPGVPEVLEFDEKTNRVYLAIKDKDLVVRIDPATNKVDATWPTTPATSPHGLVIDSAASRVFTAGQNGKLVALDMKTGRSVGVADIASGVDQIAIDTDRKIIYSACKGFISVTQVTDHGLTMIGSVPSPKGAHTLAVDSKTHGVWVSYADSDHSYFQKFKPAL